MEEDDRSNINEDSGSMDDREEEDEEEFNSGGDEEGSVEEDDAESEEEGDDDGDDSGSDSDSGESDSDDDEDESSSDDDDEDDDDEGGDEPKDGLSAYERLRLQRIARNEARLSSLGLQQMSDEIKKSKEEKKQQRRRNRQPAFDGPRRQLPGRSARATSFFIAEQSEKIVTATDNTPSLPKQKKIKKNLDACWTCQDDTGELHMCDFCRKLYHPTCDSNLNNEDAAPDDDFKCTICEKEGKNRRVPCGRCEGCKREWDCETCVYCIRKMAADEEASVRQKCIFRKCRNWGMRATVTMGEDGDGEDGGEDDDEETDDGHDAECNVCHTGGDLICCDGCPFVFHSDCHKPKIITLPDGEWFCMHCNKKPKAPKEKKSKYLGPLLADLGDREVTCVVQFPKLECLVCEGIEVTGAKKELDWTTCKICDDSFHLQCLDPPLETRPTSFRCPSCKESKRRGVPKEKKAKPLFEGVHDDDCYICRNGGNLVCCDFCEKAFHCECHIPPLPGIPTTATWKCCECAALEYKRKFRCGECSACKVKEDCGKCYSCGDKPKFGGRGLHKQGCEKRKCPYMRFAPPANANESKSKRKHFLIDGDDSPKKHKKHKKKKKLKKVKTREERLMEISAQVSDDIGDVDYDAFINRKKIKGDPVGNMILIIMKKAFGMADDAKVQEAALEHLRFIVKTAENAERAIKLGALKMVSKTMNDHPEKGGVQAVANAFLAELVWVHPPSIITVLRSGCLPLVLKSMDFHDKHVQVCTSAISVFRAMSYDFSNHWICNNINATTSIIESMKINQTNSEVLKEGCLFLQNIICNHEISSDTIDLIVSSGTIPIIVGAMSSPMENDLVECACGLLGNLAIDDDIREEIGKNSSSIAILLRILTTNPDEDVSKSAMIALKRISSDNEDNITKIVEQDGVHGVLEFLKGKSIDKDLLATGFGLLSHLTKNKSSNTSQLLDFVISEMRNHPNQPQLQAGTCSVIRNLSMDDVEQAKVANALVVAAMNRHQNDSRVQLNSCQALLNLYIQFPSIVQPLMQQEPMLFDSQSPKRKRRKVEKITADEQGVDGTADRLLEKNALGTKIIPEIKHVLRPLKNVLNNDAVGNQIRLIIITALRNNDNYKMQTTACEHLRYLVTSIKTCSTIVKLGGLKMIHISVNQHPRKTAFVAEAINLLLDLISANPSVIASIVQEGLLDLVIESMYSNGHNSRVQRASLGIFRALSYDFTKHSDIQNVKGVEGVIESMKRNPKKFDIMKDVCLILQNFLSNEERRQGTIELVTSLNVTPVVIDGMYANQDMGFLVAACGLLANLAMDEDAKIAISDYVLSIRTLLAILELNNIDADVSMSTLTVLRLLLADNQENRCKIAEVGGIKTVIDFLTAPREVIVAESGLELLAEMIKNNADNSEQLKVCGGIQFVTSLMKGKPRSAAVQAVGCRILCAFTNPSYGVSAHPIQVEEADEALKLVMSVMKSHRNNNYVQLASSHALLHFCTLFPTLIKSLDSSILCQSAFRTGIFSY
eukprot:scaffold4957_cov115-Skeletonema_dohrnii-CCMP3373.AAC.5